MFRVRRVASHQTKLPHLRGQHVSSKMQPSASGVPASRASTQPSAPTDFLLPEPSILGPASSEPELPTGKKHAIKPTVAWQAHPQTWRDPTTGFVKESPLPGSQQHHARATRGLRQGAAPTSCWMRSYARRCGKEASTGSTAKRSWPSSSFSSWCREARKWS